MGTGMYRVRLSSVKKATEEDDIGYAGFDSGALGNSPSAAGGLGIQ
jgi:hypothetical protein